MLVTKSTLLNNAVRYGYCYTDRNNSRIAYNNLTAFSHFK
jgi:hypothetical protein